ncbi:hypothetical protein BV25DRAFT_1819268 [Artomyces pyxidatus]|uniref:Uncharacterized protein n=1 Tax=Artomyces pyxidatus TaxID=48021 RepID=A0ACB8THH7_9AGAM|nr:hypothetical protein BV25DRAFT_1819268 [Artomyces pyxidatus]
MAAHSVELQKQRYSQELAAYTMRQWNAVRDSIEQAKSREVRTGSQSHSQTRNRSQSRSRGDNCEFSIPSDKAGGVEDDLAVQRDSSSPPPSGVEH